MAGGETKEDFQKRMQTMWEAGAPGYAEWVIDNHMCTGLYERFEELLVPALQGKGEVRILDLASASGEPAATLAKALPDAQVVSTDIAAAYLELGKARAAKLGLSNVSFETADAQNLRRFPDGHFDAVTCSLGLMFMPNYVKALEECARVLKPGGTFAATVWQSEDKMPFFKLIAGMAREYDPTVPSLAATALRFADPAQLLQDIAAAGLPGPQCKGIEVTFGMPAHVWWEAFMKMPLPLKPALTKAQEARPGEDLFAEAKEKLRQRMTEAGWLDADEAVRLTGSHAWFVTASKP